jgi:lipoxygenase homology domain-containing protein 1
VGVWRVPTHLVFSVSFDPPNRHLATVTVDYLNTGARSFFAHHDWLSSKARRVTLQRASEADMAALDKREYRVTVRTSDLRGAGTDSRVEVVIFGKAGDPPAQVDSGVHKLDSSANDFERGAENVFDLQCRDLGEISHIEVRKDNSGAGPAW